MYYANFGQLFVDTPGIHLVIVVYHFLKLSADGTIIWPPGITYEIQRSFAVVDKLPNALADVSLFWQSPRAIGVDSRKFYS